MSNHRMPSRAPLVPVRKRGKQPPNDQAKQMSHTIHVIIDADATIHLECLAPSYTFLDTLRISGHISLVIEHVLQTDMPALCIVI